MTVRSCQITDARFIAELPVEEASPAWIAAPTLRLTGHIHLKSATTSALIYQVNRRLASENFSAFAACRRDHDELSKQMIEDSDSVEQEDLFRLRRPITNIGGTNEDHTFCVDLLQKLESDSFRARELLEHLKDLDRSFERHQRSMDRLEDDIKDLYQQFLLAVHDKTGNRLGTLTILSAVFLPLTLISGIYGMNFDNMPEPNTPYDYYVILGFMALAGLGILGFFYIKGWFDQRPAAAPKTPGPSRPGNTEFKQISRSAVLRRRPAARSAGLLRIGFGSTDCAHLLHLSVRVATSSPSSVVAVTVTSARECRPRSSETSQFSDP